MIVMRVLFFLLFIIVAGCATHRNNKKSQSSYPSYEYKVFNPANSRLYIVFIGEYSDDARTRLVLQYAREALSGLTGYGGHTEIKAVFFIVSSADSNTGVYAEFSLKELKDIYMASYEIERLGERPWFMGKKPKISEIWPEDDSMEW